MSVEFLTPEAALIALLVGPPLSAQVLVSGRARNVRAGFGPAATDSLAAVRSVGALLGTGRLVAAAAAQPVLQETKPRTVRAGVEAMFVLDVSRSMLAASGREEPTRLERARDAAERLRASIGDVPAGIASLTDRLLPHLLPTPDAAAFRTTLERAVGIERPPPLISGNRATSFEPLAEIETRGFFSRNGRTRIVVLLSDGESIDIGFERVADGLRPSPARRIVFVHFWDEDERVYAPDGRPEVYRPDPASHRQLAELAAATGGERFAEADLDRAARALQEASRRTRRVVRSDRRETRALAPFVAAAALLPLGFLLWRRNRA